MFTVPKKKNLTFAAVYVLSQHEILQTISKRQEWSSRRMGGCCNSWLAIDVIREHMMSLISTTCEHAACGRHHSQNLLVQVSLAYVLGIHVTCVCVHAADKAWVWHMCVGVAHMCGCGTCDVSDTDALAICVFFCILFCGDVEVFPGVFEWSGGVCPQVCH